MLLQGFNPVFGFGSIAGHIACEITTIGLHLIGGGIVRGLPARRVGLGRRIVFAFTIGNGSACRLRRGYRLDGPAVHVVVRESTAGFFLLLLLASRISERLRFLRSRRSQ